MGAGFCALGGNGITGSDDWAVRDNGYPLSSLLAYLWGCLLARGGGRRLPLPPFLHWSAGRSGLDVGEADEDSSIGGGSSISINAIGGWSARR